MEMDLIGDEILDYIVIKDGYVKNKADDQQPHGLALAEISSPKDEGHPYCMFKVENGQRTVCANCDVCANVQNERNCECDEQTSKILIHTTLPDLNYLVSRGSKIINLLEVKYYKDGADYVFRPLIQAYESFFKKNKDCKLRRKLVKKLIVTSFGNLLKKPTEQTSHFCQSESNFRKILSGSEGEVLSIKILNDKLVQVTTIRKPGGGQVDLNHNIVLGLYVVSQGRQELDMLCNNFLCKYPYNN